MSTDNLTEAGAKALYEAYNAGGDPATAGLNFRGEPCPEWADLPENVREKWRAAYRSAQGVTAAAPTLEALMVEVQAWQAATFGDRSPPKARIAKLLDEVDEFGDALLEALRDEDDRTRADALEEAADVLFVVLDALRLLAATPAELRDAIAAKLTRNRGRAWAADAGGKFSGTKSAGIEEF